MRRGLVILLAVILTVLPGGTALAAEDVSAAGRQDAGTVLAIDNENLYPGMDQPYSNGYMPAVADGSVSIVLPLVPVQELQGGSINITVDLGEAASSPFMFQNYDKTVGLEEHTVNNGSGKARACLVELSLPLAEGRTNGRYPVTVHVQGQVKGSARFAQAFTLYVTVTDGIDPNALTAQDTGSADTSVGGAGDPGGTGGGDAGGEAKPKPKIMIGGFAVNQSPVLAGQEFDLSVTLQNTSDSQPIKNMKVTVNGETADVIPLGETNSFYFKKVAKKESAVIDTKLMVQQTAEPKPQKIVLHIEYEGDGGTEVTSDEAIVVQVKQPLRIEYDEPEIPQEVNAGDTMSVSLNVMNMGKGTVYNVRAEVEAPGLVPEGSLFLGNLESGAAKKGDLYMFVGTLDSGGDADAKYGYTNGKMTLSYEDEFGEVSSQEFDFSTNINPPVISAPQEEEEEEKPGTQNQWWTSAIILGAVIGGIFGIRYVLKRRKQKVEKDEDA